MPAEETGPPAQPKARRPGPRSDHDGEPEPLTPEERAEMLAAAEEDDLIELADRCLEGAPDTRVSVAPTVGTIPLCVREPVVGERFILADVLATHAEVEHRGRRGWAIRLGDAKAAALAAAICDAEAASGSGLAAQVEQLCHRAHRNRAAEAGREWAELARTEVRFQELS
jgi:alpha-D-ribose 1-methylphosphonate 5-triphosphate synthase subunit PhnG